MQPDPDHVAGPLAPGAGVLNRDVNDAATAGVDAGRDHPRLAWPTPPLWGWGFGRRWRGYMAHAGSPLSPAIFRARTGPVKLRIRSRRWRSEEHTSELQSP